MEFLSIFTDMSWICVVLLCVGLLFLFVEVFVPGFGFFGITGGVSLAAGVVVRIIQGLNLTQALTLILLVVGVIVILMMILVFSSQFGWLRNTGLFENKSTIDKDYNKPDRDIRKLVGKTGKAITNLRLAGKAKIRGQVYDVISSRESIDKGENIKVIEVKDNQIFVRKFFD